MQTLCMIREFIWSPVMVPSVVFFYLFSMGRALTATVKSWNVRYIFVAVVT